VILEIKKRNARSRECALCVNTQHLTELSVITDDRNTVLSNSPHPYTNRAVSKTAMLLEMIG